MCYEGPQVPNVTPYFKISHTGRDMLNLRQITNLELGTAEWP